MSKRRQGRPGLRKIARLHLEANGRYYWKPERRLRPHWQSVALGADRNAAEAEAARLNRKVADWLAKGEAARPRRAPVRDQALTIGQLIAQFRQSVEWKTLRPRTQVTYAYELGRLEDEFGSERAAGLTTTRVDEWLDELRFTAPGTARHVAGRGRALFAWARRKELVANPINPFAQARLGSGGKRAVRMTWEDVKLLVALCDGRAHPRPSIGHALVIGFCCVQRISDVIRLDRKHLVEVEGGTRLRFHQSKGERIVRKGETKPGFFVDVAWPAVCAQRLAAVPEKRRRPGCTALLVNERLGQPWGEKEIARAFRRIVDEAVAEDPKTYGHLAKVQLRDARRSGFVHRIENGATVEHVTAISGHSVQEGYQIVEHYLPRTAKMADAADRFLKVAW